MKITEALYGEHGVFYSLMDEIRLLTEETADLAELRGAAKLFAGVLLSHAKLEDELLFPAIGDGGPVAVMRLEHDQIDRLAAALVAARSVDELKTLLADLLELVAGHFAKEENVLFPMSDQRLAPPELERLAVQWSALRGVSIP